jgi:ubiquinone/menaquinone biosynthesis C-methylase UbiE
MSSYSFQERDFEHPSVLFVLEDRLKSLLGGPLLYNPYFKTFGLKGNEKVLDFGCGGGTGSKALARLLNKGGHLTCVDISNYWVSRAGKRLQRYTNVECKPGDIREMGISDSSFDIISVIHVIHDISPEERQDITDELSRTLKGGGQFFIREPIKESHGMPVAEIRTLLTDSGLREIKYQENKSEYLGQYQKAG